MLIVNFDKAIMRVLWELIKNQSLEEPVPAEKVAEILGRIDYSYPDTERVLRESRYLESMGFIKMVKEGLELTQVGAFLANNLEWRSEEKASAVISELINLGPA